MDLTIVIPFYQGHDTLGSLLSSIPTEFPVIIVDDVSSKEVKIRRDNTKVFRLTEKGYFSGAVNFGIQQCETDVLVLNQDVEFTSDAAFELIAHYKDKYALIGEAISGNHPAWPMKYVHGTFMYMRRDAIDAVGLLNVEHYPLWGSTCEWQLRACRKEFLALPIAIPDMIHKRKGNFGSSIAKLLSKNYDKRGLFIRTPPLVSVIVPAYNHARYLPDLINSLIGGQTTLGLMPPQTFQAFDIIIADDCSTDGTQELMQELADPWKGIKYVRTPSNSGTSVACNLAIKSSYAKYIARIDADDMRETESLEILLKAQLDNPRSFIYDDVNLFVKRGIVKPWRMGEYNFDRLIDKNFIHAGLMFPKEAWNEAGGYPKEMRYGRDDWAFNVALGLKGWCGIHVDHLGYLYRRHDDNRTIRNTTPANRAEFKMKIQKLYPEAYAQERPMGCCGGSRPLIQSQTYQAGNGGGGTYAMGAGMPGAGGMVLVEYLGANFGGETYYGPVTGSAYLFSAKKRQRWVDPRDLNHEIANGAKIGLLELVAGKKPIFKVVRQPVQAKVAETTVIAEEMTKSEGVSKPEVEVVQETAQMLMPGDVDFTVLKGIGKATADKLVEEGYYSLQQLYEVDEDALKESFGWSATKVKSIREQLEELLTNPI